MANLVTTGLAQQTAFGTAVITDMAPVKISSVDSRDLNLNYIPNDELFGTIEGYAEEPGFIDAAIGLTAYARPEMLGYLLQMFAGDPTSAGTTGAFTHAYVPSNAVPKPYTVSLESSRGDSYTFQDVLPSAMGFTQDVGGFMTVNMTGIASRRTPGAGTLDGVPEASRPFKFKDFSATIGGSANLNFKSFTVDITNPISNIHTLNGTAYTQVQEYTGKRTVAISGTMRFVDDAGSYRAEFEGYTKMALVLTWTMAVGVSFSITIPDFRINSHSVNTGFDETEVTFAGAAYYDDASTKTMSFNLANAKDKYVA